MLVAASIEQHKVIIGDRRFCREMWVLNKRGSQRLEAAHTIFL
jgi:hypothetical protein